MKTFGTMLLFVAAVASAAGCGGMSKAGGAALNVGLATAVGAARMSAGECFTWCDPQHVCNPRTGLCEKLPGCENCKEGQHCQMVGGLGVCVDALPEDVPMVEEQGRTEQPPVLLLPPPSPEPF